MELLPYEAAIPQRTPDKQRHRILILRRTWESPSSAVWWLCCPRVFTRLFSPLLVPQGVTVVEIAVAGYMGWRPAASLSRCGAGVSHLGKNGCGVGNRLASASSECLVLNDTRRCPKR